MDAQIQQHVRQNIMVLRTRYEMQQRYLDILLIMAIADILLGTFMCNGIRMQVVVVV